jgi:transcriptional regulator GlxA family with amidase domain
MSSGPLSIPSTSGGVLCDPHATDGSLHAVMAAIATSLRTLSRLWRNEIGITLPQWRTQLRHYHGLHLQAPLPVTTVASRCG